MIEIKDPNRFAEVRAAILRGECPPSTGQLKKRYHMDYYTARDYLAKLWEEQLLIKNPVNSHYQLKNPCVAVPEKKRRPINSRSVRLSSMRRHNVT